MNPDSPRVLLRPKRIVIVDDSLLFSESWRAVVAARYGEKVQLDYAAYLVTGFKADKNPTDIDFKLFL